MLNKREFLEQQFREKHKKAIRFVYLPIGILVALYAAFLVYYPLLEKPLAPGALTPSTYVVGVIMIVHTGLFQNYTKRTYPEKRHMADTFWYLLAYAIYEVSILFICGMLLGKFETAQGYYVQAMPLGVTTVRTISIYGALLAGPFVALPALLLPHYRDRKKAYMDLTVVAVLWVLAFGKLGCHAAGCCAGIHMDPVWFGRGLFPVQLLEAICMFLTIGFLMWYQLKAKWAIPGSAYALGLLLYCPVRFFWEFFREQEGFIKMFVLNGSMTFWQFLSIIGFVMGAVWMTFLVVQDKKEKAAAPKAA